jgi:hypothetical protein
MKKTIGILILLALSLTACSGRPTPAPLGADAPADAVPDIVGSYALNATDPSGEEYGGTLTIFPGDKPNEYKIQWLVTGAVHEGVGILAGNQFTVTWETVMDTEVYLNGTGQYTVTVNGELYGTRAIEGIEAPAVETAYPNPRP